MAMAISSYTKTLEISYILDTFVQWDLPQEWIRVLSNVNLVMNFIYEECLHTYR